MAWAAERAASSLGQGRHGPGPQDGFDVDGAGAAAQGDRAGAHHLLDAEAAQQRDEGVDLLLGAAVLDDDGFGTDVQDAALVELDDAQDLGPFRLGGADLDEGELVLDDAASRAGPGPSARR